MKRYLRLARENFSEVSHQNEKQTWLNSGRLTRAAINYNVAAIHLGHRTALLASDPMSDNPIACALIAKNYATHMLRFLRNVNNQGFSPQTVISDCSLLGKSSMQMALPTTDRLSHPAAVCKLNETKGNQSENRFIAVQQRWRLASSVEYSSTCCLTP